MHFDRESAGSSKRFYIGRKFDAMSVSFDQQSVEDIRARLRKMSDADLLRFRKAARYMCSPQASGNETSRPEFVLQLEEGRNGGDGIRKT